MEPEKKERKGFYLFLIILSALGMLFMVLFLAYIFFNPGGTLDIFDTKPPQLSSADSDGISMTVTSPDGNPREGALSEEDSDSVRDGREEGDRKGDGDNYSDEEMELPDVPVVLDDSDALIDGLMSDDPQGFDTEGSLSIAFDDEEETVQNQRESETTIEAPADTHVEESIAPATAEETVRYQEVQRDLYWIQVASFPNSIKADDLQSKLLARGISSTIQTRNVNGSLYYRVRIGAFESRREAENFENQLQNLPEIDETRIYTSTVTETRRVN